MRTDEWLKVTELFNAALEVAPGERGKFLDEASAGAPDLRREVESLLACESQAGGFLDAPALALSADFFDEEQAGDERAGQTVGRYRIIREVGRGGMGAVYLAERSDGEFQQQVALKVVQRSFADSELRRRFRQERQILATLNHPNIARLLDGGVSADGEPYLAMEYVEGIRFDEYCDASDLPTGERLKLFLAVCRGVSYAHQHLVVHRDIKPSNILVTKEGVPKLLDFGIAKLLDPEYEGEHTRTELRAFTPDYASPEQVAGGQITTASDVYSLGILLRDLLHGASLSQEVGKAPGGWRSETPGRKTVAAGRATDGEGEDGKARTRLRRFATGELENIVAMARHEDPARRYASAGQLAEDVLRYLDGRPVLARKDSFTYRAGKFVRRNVVGVAAAALVLLSLVGGIVATVWQARRATAERDRARVEAAKSARINEFLQHVLGFSQVGWNSPNPQKKNISTIAEALDEASRRAERELADQPEILAAVQFTLGNSYFAQGNVDAAAQHLRASLETRRRVLGPEHPDTAQSMTALAEQFVFQGKFAEAETLSREAVAVYRRASERGDVNPRWFAIALNVLGVSLSYKGDAAASQALLLEAVKVGANLTGQDRGMIAVIYGNVGIQRGNQGDVDGAVDYLQKSVEEMRRLPDRPTSNLANNLSNLGSFMTIKGEYERAEALLREAQDLNRQTVGEKHLFTIMSIIYLADNYCEQGNFSRALEEINRALALQRETLKEGHIDFARSWTILGKILTRTGQFAGGEEHLRRALALRVKALKPGHLAIAGTQGALGECLTVQGRYDEAEPLLNDSHKALEASLGGHDPRTQKALRRLTALSEARQQSPPQ
ncbi:MAG TPA: serine/threonine-protein kinase [Pyrinomonadaceae bacterium]